MPFCPFPPSKRDLLRETQEYGCKLVLNFYDLLLSFYEFLFALLEIPGQFAILPANIFHPLLNQIYQEGFVGGLGSAVLHVRWLFGNKLRQFSLAVIATRHDFFDILKRLLTLVQIPLLVCLVFVVLRELTPAGPALACFAGFELGNGLGLVHPLVSFQKHKMIIITKGWMVSL